MQMKKIPQLQKNIFLSQQSHRICSKSVSLILGLFYAFHKPSEIVFFFYHKYLLNKGELSSVNFLSKFLSTSLKVVKHDSVFQKQMKEFSIFV